jgi:hypothetical protein
MKLHKALNHSSTLIALRLLTDVWACGCGYRPVQWLGQPWGKELTSKRFSMKFLIAGGVLIHSGCLGTLWTTADLVDPLDQLLQQYAKTPGVVYGWFQNHHPLVPI